VCSNDFSAWIFKLLAVCVNRLIIYLKCEGNENVEAIRVNGAVMVSVYRFNTFRVAF